MHPTFMGLQVCDILSKRGVVGMYGVVGGGGQGFIIIPFCRISYDLFLDGWLKSSFLAGNCRLFCPMSAISDLINESLWQCSVYFLWVDLRAAAQGWDPVYPTHRLPAWLPGTSTDSSAPYCTVLFTPHTVPLTHWWGLITRRAWHF